jgi:Ca2+-binding EF-hand superfamily protein
VDKLFAMMDKDKNAQLSFEEFQEGSKKGECCMLTVFL